MLNDIQIKGIFGSYYPIDRKFVELTIECLDCLTWNYDSPHHTVRDLMLAGF